MATAEIPERGQFSKAAEHRNNMALELMPRLQHKAWRATHKLHKNNDEVFVVCIHVDSGWRWLVEELMPGNETVWQAQREAGKQPMALGLVTSDILPGLAGEFPDIQEVLLETPENGVYKGVILDDGGCTVIDVQPKEDTDNPA